MNDSDGDVDHDPNSISKAHTHSHSHSHADREASSSHPFDLERAFTHPAGLRVARQVARSLIEQRPVFGSNPEVMAQLQRIMEMNDDYPATVTSRQTSGAGATSGMDQFTPSSLLLLLPTLCPSLIPPDTFPRIFRQTID
jgi:hypothetical protein